MVDDSFQRTASAEPSPAALSRAPRTNLFLAASIEAGAASAPVRIRNLSETGAMLDGAAFPTVGDPLRLRRMDVEVGARVVWHAGSRAGVEFDGRVSVPDWVAGKYAGVGAVLGQARVDTIQAALRTGAPLVSPARPEPVAIDTTDLERRLAEEIAHVSRMIHAIGEALIEEPVVVHRHPQLIQGFDLSCQTLDHIARIMVAPDRGRAVAQIGMEELRARLARRTTGG